MNTKPAATALARRHGTRDPFRIAQRLGVSVIFTPLTGIRGFCQVVKRCRIIYIDTALPEGEARFVCAHELGHLLLHKGCNRIFLDRHTYFPVNRFEVEANRFAVDLLYDDEDLRPFLEHPVTLAADCLGIPTELAEYRLKTLGSNS